MTSASLVLGAGGEERGDAEPLDPARLALVGRAAALAPAAGDLVSLACLATASPARALV